ncbi:alkaline phosphatase family protein [Brevibacillus ruminantium]|uniref:Alkaline phosphatase family protein n=1 Tax=Brevibacillus ruminantium TaxID=2950604 RepID=A0ABY4WAN9_9BACL|nr:alkaline phosphatase family protein [Brevibacillus ruminantium]USG63839.1 alkaline phosphatase family protein [Brevibacillus ruminantium]
MKKVLLFLIDSMMPDVLEQCIAAGKAPGLQFFMERGQYIPDCVTVFPTMTASIDCSLITGVYPDRHKIPGLVWYDSEQRKMINYINGTIPVGKIGLEHCAKNVLFDLNERHLSREVKTIHEVLEEHGLISGSINVIAHRGHKKHKVTLPPALDAATRFSLREKVSGPTIMSMGTLVKPNLFRPVIWNFSQSALGSYGINDAHAIDILIEVVRSGQQPDFTLIYLPDNDHKLHRTPGEAISHLADVDKELVRFLDSYSSWEQVLEDQVCLFISDHGQTLIGETDEHNIDLENLLSAFAIHALGAEVTDKDDLVLCNNERMTYLYPLRSSEVTGVIEAVSVDSRIDLIAWKEDRKVRVVRGGTKESLLFWKNGPYHDVYQQSWGCHGDLSVLDIRLDGAQLSFDQYPDAFSRLYGALFSQAEQVIVLTAAPGYEFVSEAAPTHLGGGSHGSLHKRDSLVPLMIAGGSRPFTLPARLVDVKGYILEELGVTTPNQ